MYGMQALVCGIALVVQIAQCIPLVPADWDLAFFDEASSQERFANASSITEFAQELGISEEFLKQLKENWEKAVEDEKVKGKERQAGIGDFFGLGGGGGGGGGNFGGGGGAEDDEDDGDDEATMAPGPGAAGVLTGLLGIFSGLGTLNPQRVIQSTVNFFPPHQRGAAQMALNAAFGIHNATTTTLAPLTDAPPRNGTGRPGPILTAGVNATSTTPKSLARKGGVATTVSPEEDTTRKKLVLKETSLLEDFEEAAVKLTPVVIVVEESKVKEGDKEGLSSLENDFANTANKFLSSVKETTGPEGESIIIEDLGVSNTTNANEVVEVIEISATEGNPAGVAVGTEVEKVENYAFNATTTEAGGTTPEIQVVQISATEGSEGGKEEEKVESFGPNPTTKPEILRVIVTAAK